MADIAEIGFAANTNDLLAAKKALNELTPATKKAEKATDNLNDEFDRGSKSANKFKSVVKSAAGGLNAFAGGVLGGFVGSITAGGIEGAIRTAFTGLMQISDEIEHMNNIATAAGGSVGGVQVLSIALSAAGVEMSEIQTAAKKLNTALGDIAIGSGPGAKLAKAALDQLGLSASALSAMDVDKRFMAIGDAVKRLGMNASQTAALLDNIGIKSTNMIAALSGGGDVIRDVGDQVEKLGLKLTAVDVQNLAHLDDSFDKLGITGQAALMKIAAAFSPLVAGAADEANKFIATTIKEMMGLYNLALQIDNLGQDLAAGTVKQVGVGEDDFVRNMNLKFKLAQVENELATNAANARNSLNSEFDTIVNLGVATTGVTPKLDDLLQKTDLFGDAATGAIPTLESLSSGFETLGVTAAKVGGSGGAIDNASDTFEGLSNAIDKAAESERQLRENLQSGVVDAFKGFFTDLMHGVSAIDALTSAFGKLADKLMDMVLDGALNSIIGSLFGGMGSIAGGAAIPSGGFIPGITGPKLFAKGGVVNGATAFASGGGMGIMGEAGPEAIMPLHRAANGGLGVAMASNDNYGGRAINLNVVINNNAANDTEASASMGDDGSLIVTIDKIVASNLGNPSSQTNKAMQRGFGVKNTTAQR